MSTAAKCSAYIIVPSYNLAKNSTMLGFVKICFLKFIAVNLSTYTERYHVIG